MHFRCRDGIIEFIYQDGLPINHVKDVHLLRASSIDPLPDGVQFKIVWAKHIQPFVGESETLQDDAGQPFMTKAAAEAYEVKRLERDYIQSIRDHSPPVSAN